MAFLVDLYEHKLGPFLRREIDEGRPDETLTVKDEKADKDKKGEAAADEQPLDDENFLVNRSIAQNLHFLFGAFVQALVNSHYTVDHSITSDQFLQELASPLSVSDTITSPLPAKILASPAATTPVIIVERDRLRFCIQDIL